MPLGMYNSSNDEKQRALVTTTSQGDVREFGATPRLVIRKFGSISRRSKRRPPIAATSRVNQRYQACTNYHLGAIVIRSARQMSRATRYAGNASSSSSRVRIMNAGFNENGETRSLPERSISDNPFNITTQLWLADRVNAKTTRELKQSPR